MNEWKREIEKVKPLYVIIGNQRIDVGDVDYMINICRTGVIKPFIYSTGVKTLDVFYQIYHLLLYFKQKFYNRAKEMNIQNMDMMIYDYILRTLYPEKYSKLIKSPSDSIRIFASIKICIEDYEMCVFNVLLDNIEFQLEEEENEELKKRILTIINTLRPAIINNCIYIANINIIIQAIDMLLSYVRKLILKYASGVEIGKKSEGESEE